ncbi:MAG TPA: maleylacetoacetate isomerase, partial [Pseudobdellovibrionaceae bacterium]|nr:maleylacetoacetate isomerase [Pseudobdellovibrionaceae bacterium]
IPVHLLEEGGQHRKSDYAQLNPQKEVPTLVHQGKVLSQSLPMMEYLEEVFPGPSYLPKDPYQKARIRQFCENINSFMHPLNNLKVLQYLEKKHNYSAEDKEVWIQNWSHQGFEALEKMLESTASQNGSSDSVNYCYGDDVTYCFGDTVTMADFCLIPQVFSAQRFNVDISKYPRIQRINSSCLKLDYFQSAHPHNQIDTPKELLVKKINEK